MAVFKKIKSLVDEFNSWTLIDKIGIPFMVGGSAIMIPLMLYAAATGNLHFPDQNENIDDGSGAAVIFMAPPLGPGMK